jgi:hypothetical protein
MSRIFRSFGLSLAVVLVASTSNAAVVLTHQYRLDGTDADDLGGPSLVSLGGNLVTNPGNYTFAANQGLSLSSALSGSGGNYSIEMFFEFDNTAGYRKILDFKGLGTDTGLYNLNTALYFYPISAGPPGTLANGTFARVVLTRDSSTNTVTGYVNNNQQFTFIDGGGSGVFNQPNNIIYFFRDDNFTSNSSSPGESSSGRVDYIRIYDSVLTLAEVGQLVPPAPLDPVVPEPASLAMWSLVGLVGCRTAWRRAKQSAV